MTEISVIVNVHYVLL